MYVIQDCNVCNNVLVGSGETGHVILSYCNNDPVPDVEGNNLVIEPVNLDISNDYETEKNNNTTSS